MNSYSINNKIVNIELTNRNKKIVGIALIQDAINARIKAEKKYIDIYIYPKQQTP
jgi:hypothetical protein